MDAACGSIGRRQLEGEPEHRRQRLLEAASAFSALAGQLTEKAAPSGEHGYAQASVVGATVPPFQREEGSRSPGGWWIAIEVELLLSAARPLKTIMTWSDGPNRPRFE